MTNVRRSMRRREGPMKRVFTSPGGGVEIPAGREQTFVLDGPHTSNWDESKDTESEAIVRAGLTRLSGADKDLVKGSFFKKNMDAENVLLPVTLDGSNRKRLHGAVDGLPGTISYLGNETPGIGLLVASATQTIRLGWLRTTQV
ncbi:uncharacterized protein LMH87_008980 [Akanthomyces muscarius]|uniref:Uncharacterized protein n=1 Tax=Akanthomyces muscarius TaxID=2231603 RepID=A0A9W8UNY2_AKAMU|nr:uncharacterized protein LMH87_008980 [Akanthomyces muscarius]KAJ4158454.1 hypothetical protein LMH87_008980 [Akanthomyces muscarius]